MIYRGVAGKGVGVGRGPPPFCSTKTHWYVPVCLLEVHNHLVSLPPSRHHRENPGYAPDMDTNHDNCNILIINRQPSFICSSYFNDQKTQNINIPI